ncbi:MAG: cyclic nucleotide-binding domain-containing protein [Mariprofundaceae bacterium]
MTVRDDLMHAFEASVAADPLYARFRAMPVCQALGMRESMTLFSCFQTVRVKKGEVLYRAGEVSDNTMRLIVEGEVAVASANQDIYARLGAGDVFGLFSFLDENRPHSATVTAASDLTLLAISRDYFNAITVEDPVLGHELLRFMFRLLSRMALKLESEYAAIHEFALARRG